MLSGVYIFQASSFGNELQASKEFWEWEKLSFPGESTLIVTQYQMVTFFSLWLFSYSEQIFS